MFVYYIIIIFVVIVIIIKKFYPKKGENFRYYQEWKMKYNY